MATRVLPLPPRSGGGKPRVGERKPWSSQPGRQPRLPRGACLARGPCGRGLRLCVFLEAGVVARGTGPVGRDHLTRAPAGAAPRPPRAVTPFSLRGCAARGRHYVGVKLRTGLDMLRIGAGVATWRDCQAGDGQESGRQLPLPAGDVGGPSRRGSRCSLGAKKGGRQTAAGKSSYDSARWAVVALTNGRVRPCA